MEKIENFLKDLAVSLQIAKIYTTEHPSFKGSIDKTYNNLLDILSIKGELTIGFVGEELAFEKEILFDLSKKLRPVIFSFKERNIEIVSFVRGLVKEELTKLVSYFTIPKDELKKSAQEHLLLLGIRHITVGKIGIGGTSEVEVKKSIGRLQLYEDCLDRVDNSVTDVFSGNAIDYLDLRFTMVNVMENLIGRYQEFLKLTAIKKYDIGTFSHLLNVAILSIHFSYKIGFTRDDCLDIGIAALFHDMGKVYISRKIVQKPDRLTDEEFSKIKSHTILGAEILLKYVETLGILPAVVAFEHHLRYDLKGYPKLAFVQKPHIASLLVSICDVYDALTQKRTYKRDYPPKMIYDLMMREKDGAFEPHLLERFFKTMGVWPIGTIVLLSNNNVAIVRQEHEEDIFFPVVQIVSEGSRNELIDLKEKKSGLAIERSLNPLSEGQQYLSLV